MKSQQRLIEELVQKRVWAVLGVSQNTSKFGYRIFKDLLGAGYQAYPIHPALDYVDGHKCYRNVLELPEKPAVVNFVIPPSVSEKAIEDCIQAGIEAVWFQPGAESPVAIEKAQKAGLEVVYDACILIERKTWD